MPTPLVALFALLVVLPGQAQDIGHSGPGAAWYIPPINPFHHWYEVRGGTWRVPLAIVQDARVLIEGEIRRNKYFYSEGTASRYAIQFRGETVEGRQVVRMFGACNALEGADWKLSEQFLLVADGGKCYFEADYRPEDGRFRLRYHGHA